MRGKCSVLNSTVKLPGYIYLALPSVVLKKNWLFPDRKFLHIINRQPTLRPRRRNTSRVQKKILGKHYYVHYGDRKSYIYT